ncbi:MAG: tautomerase family protein [Alistipes sp.]|nr:tautomerase family protein [Alistipes sp.]
MPYISIESGPLSETRKQQLIERITDVAAETTGIPRQFFMVVVKELPDSCFGIGGRTLDRIKAEYGRSGE